jgi:prevent-host-death family protein
MSTVSVQDAQSKLSELIHKMKPGDEVVITENNQPVARLIPVTPQPQRKLGTLKGTVTYMAADFDAPLDEFKEYMP